MILLIIGLALIAILPVIIVTPVLILLIIGLARLIGAVIPVIPIGWLLILRAGVLLGIRLPYRRGLGRRFGIVNVVIRGFD